MHLPEAWGVVPAAGGARSFDGAAYHYLTHVLRVAPGQPLVLFDGDGHERSATVERVDAQAFHVALGPSVAAAVPDGAVPVTLLAGLTRGGALDRVVRQATELGVDALWPVVCARSVAVPAGRARREQRQQRWQRIAASAAAQCGRASVPQVAPIRTLPEALALLAPALDAGALGLVAQPGSSLSVSCACAPRAQVTWSAVALLVGAEGGLRREEVGLAMRAGLTPVGLGPRVLRAETAATTLLALAQQALGGLA